MKDCLFCKIAEGSIPADILYQDDDVLVFRDIHPMAPHHLLVIPRKHIARVEDLESGDTELAGKLILTAKKVAKDLGLKKGYRLVFNNGSHGGQQVLHIHLHLLGGRPLRWPPG